MPFSLSSYLIGVGTVVGALAFGFGGGVLLTNTAMKDTPPGQTRLERVARAEPQPAAATPAQAAQTTPPPSQPAPNQIATASNPVTPPDQAHSASAAAVTPDAAPAQQPAAADMPKQVEAARKPETDTPKQVEAAREPSSKQAAVDPQPAKKVDQTERVDTKPVESRETDRRTERPRRYADRRLRDNLTTRVREQRYYVREESAPEVVVSNPPEQRIDVLGGLFGRPIDVGE
jgi:hypothetical protein